MSESIIPFNRPFHTELSGKYMLDSLDNGWTGGDGPFTKKSQFLLEEQLVNTKKVLLTTSCTHALEMAAILLDLQPGDEVIVPSYTFVSSALAFYMHGAKIIFSDVRPDTFNIDESKLESLVTSKTRAIVVVHYAGVACEMDKILQIAHENNIVVIEDNAHGLYGRYKNKMLGTIGHLATLSFHETKSLSCGEGGALIINDDQYLERAEIIREKGTDRSKFFRGQVDKYSWVDKGSSYVISDVLAALLLSQLETSEIIQRKRMESWNYYNDILSTAFSSRKISPPVIPDYCEQSYHMYYLMLQNNTERNNLILHLKNNNIAAVFHYLPLHSSSMGSELGYTPECCPVTTSISERIIRLPFYTGIEKQQIDRVVDSINNFL